MKIFKAFGSGFRRSVKAWKGVLIVWLFSLLMVSLVALPLKGAMKGAFGKSMITERLLGGLDIEVLADPGANLRSLAYFFSSGLFFLIVIGILVYAFLAGGLFTSLRKSDKPVPSSEFFRASAGNFWSFLCISLIISIIMGLVGFVVVGLPLNLVSQLHSGSEKTPYVIAMVTLSMFFIFAVILNLVADYSRAWLVTREEKSCFKAIGFGFSRTFGKFLSSFPLMFITLIVLVLFNWLVLTILGPWRPVTGVGGFLLFIVSQILFFCKVLLKTWRYGSVTSLMEQNNPDENQINETSS